MIDAPLLGRLTVGVLLVGVFFAPASAGAQKNVPMSPPELMLALHEQTYGHKVSFVELADGRILLNAGTQFRISEDGGLSWSPPFTAKDAPGATVEGRALVRLSANAIGLASMRRPPDAATMRDVEALFRRSEDGGKTWSAPVVINAKGPPTAVFLQDTLLRTSSGRIILPVYLGLGQPGAHQPWLREGGPIPGAFLNGIFISTDVHFYDPSFTASYIFYSDDDGKTWRRNEDGELFVLLEPGGYVSGASEPSVTEVTPGKLLMLMRTRLGRYYQAWSYNDGRTWTRAQPTHLAGTSAPAQVRRLANGHLLCVFNQHSEEEVRKGFHRTRLTAAISRNGGRLAEHFQNVESIHEEPHLEPGPMRTVRAAGRYSLREADAYENDGQYVVALPAGWGSWSYASVLPLKDRVLISYTHSWYDENGVQRNPNGSRLKVLPIKWFYGGREPSENPILKKLQQP